MKSEILDISELTDSKEMMLKQNPKSISIFIYIMCALLATALIWSYFGKIDTYVTAAGEIRPFDDMGTLTAQSGGKIKKIYKSDGETVRAGEIIMQLDYVSYALQKENYEKQVADRKRDIDDYNRLITAISEENNPFDEVTDNVFYHQYKGFEIELKTMLDQIDNSNEQVDYSKKEFEQGIKNAKEQLSQTKSIYNEYSALYKAISDDTEYKGSSEALNAIYDSYVISLNSAKVKYEDCKLIYDALVSESQNGNIIEKSQIEQAKYAMEAAQADVISVKGNMLIELDGTLNELNAQKITYQSNIDSLELKIEASSFDDSVEDTTDKIKNSYYVSINNSIDSLENEIRSINAEIESINEAIERTKIRAANNGIVVFSQSYIEGDTIASGSIIGTVVPSTDYLSVDLYIPEQSIAEIKPNQNVEYIINSISSTDYGKIKGKIESISADSFSDQATGQKYYKAKATIEKSALISKEGQVRRLKSGMIVEAHAITGTQRLLYKLLDKLNLM